MRTFGTLSAVGILALAAGCGGSSSSSAGYTSPTGRTVSSGGYVCENQSCAAQDTYYSCVEGKCDAQAKTCFGPSYASGTFAGTCQAFITCTMACPCDANGSTCLATCLLDATTDCQTCVGALQTCQSTATCVPATCPNDSGTAAQNDAATAKNDGSTATGTNCATALVCCASIPAVAAAYIPTCQATVAAAAGDETACAQVVSQFKANGLTCQ